MMPLVVSLVLAVALFMLWSRWRTAARAEFIRKFHLPKGLFDKLTAQHPHLTKKDCELVAQALRQFFLAHLKSGREFVAMPSQVVDDLWHELILHTRTYAKFCQGSFGRFMHHTPAVELGSARVSNTGLRRCWWFACREENINPRQPTRLPLLFAIDSKLNIRDGFRYVPDVRACANKARMDLRPRSIAALNSRAGRSTVRRMDSAIPVTTAAMAVTAEVVAAGATERRLNGQPALREAWKLLQGSSRTGAVAGSEKKYR